MRRREAGPYEREAIAPYFDESFYTAAYPHAHDSTMRPIDHFLLEGWRAGLNPSRSFDVAFYLHRHGDVAAAGMNPLVHYALQGVREGRPTRRPLDAERQDLCAASAPSAQLANWVSGADRSEPIGPQAFASALAETHHAAGLVVSVSHDDYAVCFGGVQNLVGDEQRAFQSAGWAYLHLSPAAPLPVLACAGDPGSFRFRARLSGSALGVTLTDDLVTTIGAWRGRGLPVRLVIHHIMGHSPEALVTLAEAAGGQPVVWTHDFFTLCPSYALMRNGVRFCGGPPPSSAACQICSYGEDRDAHLPRVRAFFEATAPVVIAPSASALHRWQSMNSLYTSAAVAMPLATLAFAPVEPGTPQPAIADAWPIRVAHLGARVGHKGWIAFEELAIALSADPRYAFFHLGQAGAGAVEGGIRHVPVQVTAENREAMIDAIAEHRIDVVMCWSMWPETFCFTVHEALAGGAFVVAREAAGNVGPAIEAHAPRQGCVVGDEQALRALFETGEILQRLGDAERRYGALRLGRGTADWLLQAGELDRSVTTPAYHGEGAGV